MTDISSILIALAAVATGALMQYMIQCFVSSPVLRLIFPFSLVLVYIIMTSGESSEALRLMEYLICCELGGTVIGAAYHKSKR